MDTGMIKEKTKQIAEVRDKTIKKTMTVVDDKTKGKGTVVICMAVLILGALAFDQKLVAVVFGLIALADVISAVVPASKKTESTPVAQAPVVEKSEVVEEVKKE